MSGEGWSFTATRRMTHMNKKNREEQSRREDQALVRGMLWVVGAIVLEGLLFVLNRYAFNYNTT